MIMNDGACVVCGGGEEGQVDEVEKMWTYAMYMLLVSSFSFQGGRRYFFLDRL